MNSAPLTAVTEESDLDVGPLLEQLRAARTVEDRDVVLDKIVAHFTDPQNDEHIDDMSSDCCNQGLLDDLLSIVQSDKQHTIHVAEVLAEVAKSECAREPCVQKGFVPMFLTILDQNNDVPCMMQACRALGNMCFDNDAGRMIVDENNGISILLSLLRSLLSNTDTGADKLRTIACGFLLNLTNSNELMQQKAVDGGALDILEQYLQHYQMEDGPCNMVLVAIASITDSDSCKEKLLSSSLCSTLVEFLRSPNSDLHYESILDILINLAESDEIKDLLAGTDLCKYLMQMAQVTIEDDQYSEDNQQKVKMSSDLLILLLTGEKSMELLFDGGKGAIFPESLKWLDSKEDHLQLSGALAVGNFARSDEHCKFLMDQGVVQKLLVVIKPTYGKTKCTLEHAALSALRNLAIPVSNKAALIKAGVIDSVLVLVDSELLAVVFKLLGVLRMLVDGQDEAALRLGMDREFITRLVEWCAVDEHPGVKGEATRLLAWIVKNSRSADVMRQIIRSEGIPYLVTMAMSEHVVMQNESLVALTLIGSVVLAEAAVALKEADLTETILTLLKDETTLPEILCNTLTLTKTLCTAVLPSSQSIPCTLLACTGLMPGMRSDLRDELLSSGISDVVSMLCNHDDAKVEEAAKSIKSYMDEIPLVER